MLKVPCDCNVAEPLTCTEMMKLYDVWVSLLTSLAYPLEGWSSEDRDKRDKDT